ncbi:LysR family transcriptional regulator [Saccharophagus degradans]|uniref:HTH-type transcriptional regulator MetR n=1 Tax=Saccharophagus degradans (strain 2-40 / ATCC 43961 / DSM 17024) TaxID=203122 RepID=Q21N30_SACD2|nr:LysR family transcriptional regulator [Saccharophagus degradans]ABD79899.1 metal dependent phosphohydrolase [Saccharophagus degradans 2-40]
MIERQHLLVMRALDSEGSLAAAADTLNLTQSALSHSIKKLEDRLGVTLWQKQGRKLRLTQAGEYLLRAANNLLPQLEQVDTMLRAFGEGRKGQLRLGMECHPCYEWLMTVVAPFLTRWPDVDLDVIQQFRFDGLAALREHKIDILITSDPMDAPELAHCPVLDYELLLVVAANTPQAKLTSINAGDLQQQTLITFPVERARLDVFTHFLIPAAIEPKRQHAVETIEVMLQLVSSNRGVCTLPNWLVEKYQHHHPISGVRLGQSGVHKTLYLVYRRDDSKLDYINDFLTTASKR